MSLPSNAQPQSLRTKPCIRPGCGGLVREKFPGDQNYKKGLYCSLPCFKETLKKTLEQAFAEKVDKGPHPKGCWYWTGSIKPRNGYGHMRSAGKDYNAHRVAYELAKGPIPAGMCVMHDCDVPHCVNPGHLKLGTHRENMAEMWVKDRGPSKLTPEAVRDIRKRAAEGVGNQELAAEYGVDPKTIIAVKHRKKWKHVQ